MWVKFYQRIYWLYFIGVKCIFNNVVVKGDVTSKIKIGKGVKLKNVTIFLSKNSSLVINDNVKLLNVDLNVNGSVYIGNNNIIYNSDKKRNYIDINGVFFCGDNNRLETSIRVRFGGKLTIGNYNNVNSNSEIRCDESIVIGHYNQISYNVMIWDTNTHNIYSATKRREITESIGMGSEYEKPHTAKIIIGDDCWIGKNVSILKGVKISNKCIIGYQTLLTNTEIESNTTIVTDISYKQFKNNI